MCLYTNVRLSCSCSKGINVAYPSQVFFGGLNCYVAIVAVNVNCEVNIHIPQFVFDEIIYRMPSHVILHFITFLIV